MYSEVLRFVFHILKRQDLIQIYFRPTKSEAYTLFKTTQDPAGKFILNFFKMLQNSTVIERTVYVALIYKNRNGVLTFEHELRQKRGYGGSLDENVVPKKET